MKKMNWKSSLVTGAAAAMAGIMVACSGSAASTAAAAAGADAGQASEQNTAGISGENSAASGALPVISFMTTSFFGTDLKNDRSDEVIKMYEEHTGVRVDWRWEANDTYTEKLGLTLMDRSNMPMVLTASGNLTANVVDAARKGAFWDLSPYLSDSAAYPNLSQANPDVLKALTVEGEVIALYRARPIGRLGFSYRTDWAEAVGITKAPETPEEVYDMMYKFTYEDPDGNGVDDTYGLELTKYVGPLDVIQTWFGTGNEWVEKDGKLIPVHQTPEFMEALSWMRKMYAEGLVRKDWPTVDSGTFGDACKKGEAGCFVDVMDGAKRIWDYYNMNEVKSVTDPSVNAAMTLVGPINNRTLATSGFNGYYMITKAGAKTEEDVKNCLRYLDRMGDDAMLVLADHGLEGLTYDLNEKGNIVKRNELEPQYSPSSGLNQSLCYIPNMEAISPALEKSDSMKAQAEAYKVNEKVAVFNPALGYLANSEVNAEVGADIEQIIDDARTQYVCGQIDEAGFEAAARQWLERGGDRLIEDINRLYQEDTSR